MADRSFLDVVIPAHEKDMSALPSSIGGALEHLSPIRNIYVVSQQPATASDPRVHWVPEPDGELFPSIGDFRARLARRGAETPRTSWIYQQVLKLGAGEYIPSLSARYLVVDADVIFVRPVSFLTADDVHFVSPRTAEFHVPYQEAFAYLFGVPPSGGHSMIAHHAVFDRTLLSELKAEIVEHCGCAWHEAYADATDAREWSAISEFNIYGWWVLDRHPAAARVRRLVWRDVCAVPSRRGLRRFARDYDFVAAHAYLRAPTLKGLSDKVGAYRRPRSGEIAAVGA